MSEAKILLPALGNSELTILWAVLGSSLVALGYGWYLVRKVMANDPGPASMTAVATAIEEGAMAYLRRQVKVMLPFVATLALGLWAVYTKIYDSQTFAVGVALAFLLGVLASYGAGFVGMWLAVKANVRSANAALTSFKKAMELAFEAGAVSGMFTVGFGLL